jgi:hypothetical protein
LSKQPQNASTQGLRLIGQGREAEVFECRDGRVLKLLRAPGPSKGLAFEIAALHAARSAGVSVPQAYEEVVIDGRTGLMMERLEGSDLLTIIGPEAVARVSLWPPHRRDPCPDQCGPSAGFVARRQGRCDSWTGTPRTFGAHARRVGRANPRAPPGRRRALPWGLSPWTAHVLGRSIRRVRLVGGQARRPSVRLRTNESIAQSWRASTGHPAHAETLGQDRAARSDLFISALLRTPYGGADRRNARSSLGDREPRGQGARRGPG